MRKLRRIYIYTMEGGERQNVVKIDDRAMSDMVCRLFSTI